MKILVRNILSGDFLDGNGGWTKEPQRARNFEKTFQAVEAAANLNASQLELLLFFDDPVFDVRIPMRSMPLSRPKGFARMTGVDPDENRIAKAGMDVMVMPTSDVKRGGNPR